jgi:hypothetical protein
MSYLRIPKVRVVISKLVERIAYDPFGIFGSTNPQDYITITANRPTLSAIKGFNDPFSSLDDIVFKYLAGRRITDSVTINDATIVQFVTAVLRQISETTTFVDRPFLLQIPATLRDSISLDDTGIRFIRLRDQKPQDSIDIADALNRTFSAYRVFADAVGMIDNFTLIDGSTYTLDKGIYEFLTVGSDIPVRVSNNAAENVAFFVNKVLLSTTQTLDALSLYKNKQLTDDQSALDALALWNDKGITDLFNLTSSDQLFVDKAVTDVFEPGLEDLAFIFLKSLTDTASMIDNLDLGDQLVYDSSKTLADEFTQSDAVNFYVGLTAVTDSVSTDDETIQGAILLDPIKALADNFNLNSAITNYDIGKGLVDSIDPTEVLRILRPYVYADTVSLTDLLTPAFIKGLTLLESLTAATQKAQGVDRILLTKRINDTAEEIDQLRLTTRYIRGLRDGFTSTATLADANVQSRGIVLKTGSYQNIPLLRTNLIYFSEQFGATYWEKFNTSIDSDSYPFPDLVYLNPSTTVYDPSYEAANIMEIFEGYQYRNPAGTAWYREAKLTSQSQAVSAGDLVIEDAVVGRHYVEATAETDFVTGQRFVFGVHLKPVAGGRRYVKLDVADEYYAIFDIQVGAVVGTNADGAQVGRASTDGWLYCSLTARLPEFNITDPEDLFVLDVLLNKADNPRSLRRWSLLPNFRQQHIRIQALEDNSLNEVYLGTGAGAFYVWGAQLELGDQVEQEISSVNYIRTAGGQASRTGFNIMPRDGDRVWVGSLNRASIHVDRMSNSSGEKFTYALTKTNMPEQTDIMERKQLLLTRVQKLDQTIEFSSTTVAAGTGSEVVFIGRQDLNDAYNSGEPLETVNRLVSINGKRGFNADPLTSTQWIRTNLIDYSEDFRVPNWTKVRTISFRSNLLTSGNLPYRSTEDDANVVMELFEIPKPNTYYQNRGYEEVPLSNLPDYTSNVVCDVYEQPLFGEHLVQTTVFDDNLNKDVFSYSVYASPAGGVSRFRLQVNNDQYADFDLSSVTVVTSNVVYLSSIQTIDSSNAVYLCRIIGPAVRIRETFSSQDFLQGVVVGTSDTIRIAANYIRSFESTPVQSLDNFIYGLVIDYMGGDLNEDYQVLSGDDIDYQIAN